MTDGLVKTKPRNDLTGMTFGRLTVLRQANDYVNDKNRHFTAWWCKCSCGNPNEIKVRSRYLVNGTKKSCGCLQNSTKFKNRYNTYDLSGDYGKGYTYDGIEFWFDKEDYDLIKDKSWHAITSSTGAKYIIYQDSNKKNTHLSRLVMGVSEEDYRKAYIDHKNGNTIDNRKSNLRIVTPSQNGMNSALSTNNTTGVKGVYWYKPRLKWFALITKNRKRIHLGYFDNFEDAVKARKEAEEKYFGEFSYDNSRGLKKEAD